MTKTRLLLASTIIPAFALAHPAGAKTENANSIVVAQQEDQTKKPPQRPGQQQQQERQQQQQDRQQLRQQQQQDRQQLHQQQQQERQQQRQVPPPQRPVAPPPQQPQQQQQQMRRDVPPPSTQQGGTPPGTRGTPPAGPQTTTPPQQGGTSPGAPAQTDRQRRDFQRGPGGQTPPPPAATTAPRTGPATAPTTTAPATGPATTTAPQMRPGGAPVAGPQRIDQLRSERREERQGNRTIIRETDRTIVREGNRAFIQRNELERLRDGGRFNVGRFGGQVRMERRGNDFQNVIIRPGGVQIINIVDANGHLIRRIRRGPDGREIILIDNRPRGSSFFVMLPPPVIRIPRERYIYEWRRGAPFDEVYGVLMAPPVEPIERAYSLDEVLYSPALRDRMPRIDLDTILFDTGSWEITPDQMDQLATIADGVNRAIQQNPQEMFLVEGHTDAVGSDVDNLSLSDRRAESVARALTEQFGVPPENLTSQGYGEQNLKIPTDGPEPRNRYVTVRRITPLLEGRNQ